MKGILDGKVVAITGAFGFLGIAVAHAALEAGATVAAIDRVEQANAPVFPAGIQAWGGGDLGTPTGADAVFKSIGDTLGGIDALVNVAGGFRWETVADGSIDTWDLL